MRVAVALGSNALLKRGHPVTAEVQRINVRTAAPALAAVGWNHQLVLSYGNGPLAGTECVIGYLLERELGNLLPIEVPLATLLTMVEVDPGDPGFANPTRFVGPIYDQAEAERLASEKRWVFKLDGEHWRRVVPAPEPQRIFEVRAIRWLLDRGVVVICAGGGGVPTMYAPNAERTLVGVEAVIDKDLASELLAREVDADLLVMVTDVDGVYADWGTERQRRLDRVTPDELRSGTFAAGSMGPKVEAACRFVERTGKRAAIGGLVQIEEIVEGGAGTQVVSAAVGATRAEQPDGGSGHG